MGPGQYKYLAQVQVKNPAKTATTGESVPAYLTTGTRWVDYEETGGVFQAPTNDSKQYYVVRTRLFLAAATTMRLIVEGKQLSVLTFKHDRKNRTTEISAVSSRSA